MCIFPPQACIVYHSCELQPCLLLCTGVQNTIRRYVSTHLIMSNNKHNVILLKHEPSQNQRACRVLLRPDLLRNDHCSFQLFNSLMIITLLLNVFICVYV